MGVSVQQNGGFRTTKWGFPYNKRKYNSLYINALQARKIPISFISFIKRNYGRIADAPPVFFFLSFFFCQPGTSVRGTGRQLEHLENLERVQRLHLAGAGNTMSTTPARWISIIDLFRYLERLLNYVTFSLDCTAKLGISEELSKKCKLF